MLGFYLEVRFLIDSFGLLSPRLRKAPDVGSNVLGTRSIGIYMKIEKQKIKSNLILILPIFFGVFLIASTNTLGVICGLSVFILTLIIIYLITFYTDKKFESRFNKISLLILATSMVGIAFGILTFPIQEAINKRKAENLINEIEKFKALNNRLPEIDTEIKIPESRNGLYVKQFEFYKPEMDKSQYTIKYFDGFWNTKVYLSNEKKWYTDD